MAAENGENQRAMAQQSSLFDTADLPPPAEPPLGWALAISGQALAPEQKQFNLLLTKIEKLKESLAQLQTMADDFRQQYRKKISPLLEQQQALNKRMLYFLDQRLQGKGLSANVRGGMEGIVCNLALAMVQGPDRQEMIAVLERYHYENDEDDEELDAEITAEMKSTMSNLFGVDMEDDELEGSPEEIFAATMRKMHEAQAQRDAAKARRKKTPQQKASAQDDLDAGKALQAIYRKLASALHPDRESDDTERLRKTALMKQVNAAYANKDLLALLQLQLAAEQINPHSMTAVAQDKLRHFNRVLKEQASSLQEQVRSTEDHLRSEFAIDHYGRITAGTLQAALRSSLQGVNAQILCMQRDLQLIQTDPALKRWVKEQLEMMHDAELYF
jgi:hypothetical protein